MRILGIDPGLKLTGYGVIDWTSPAPRPRLVDAGVIRLDAKAQLAARLARAGDRSSTASSRSTSPRSAPSSSSTPTTPTRAPPSSWATPAASSCSSPPGTRDPIEQFAANRIKQSVTGHGHAGKAQMQRAIQSTWNLPAPPEPPDVADALAIALCCGRSMEVERAISGGK